MGVGMGPKIFGTLGPRLLAVGAWLTAEIRFSPCVTLPNLVVLGHMPENFSLTSSLSRSLKVIGTNRDRSTTYDFLLTFRSNHGPRQLIPQNFYY